MYLKDRIRVYTATAILLLIGLTYFLTEDKELAGYAAVAGLLIWFGMMFYLRGRED
jgi:hypothetical protein